MDWRRRRTIRSTLGRLPVRLSVDPLLPQGVVVGAHTFAYGVDTFQIYRPGARIEVGAYCSIHAESRILAGADHITSRASTFPFNARIFDPGAGGRREAIDKGATTIGNDVWIGTGAIVLSGVVVGDGAAIGAGAVVSKSVPSYAVVAGNPAAVIRYRFSDDTRRRLQALAWWDWSDEHIWAARQWFSADIESFLDEMERVHQPGAESAAARRLRKVTSEQMTPDRARPTA